MDTNRCFAYISPIQDTAVLEEALRRRRRNGAEWLRQPSSICQYLLGLMLCLLPTLNAQGDESPKQIVVLDIELLKADHLPDAQHITSEEHQRLNIIAKLIRERLHL